MHTTTPHNIHKCYCKQVTLGEDGKVIELSIFRQVKTQYLGPPNVKGIQDSHSEQEEKQRKDQATKELTLVAQKAGYFYEKYVKTSKNVITDMCSLVKDHQRFLVDL